MYPIDWLVEIAAAASVAMPRFGQLKAYHLCAKRSRFHRSEHGNQISDAVGRHSGQDCQRALAEKNAHPKDETERAAG